ncbi:hypothetical protein ACVBEF_00260 [Glaciimonas sp. GG7]
MNPIPNSPAIPRGQHEIVTPETRTSIVTDNASSIASSLANVSNPPPTETVNGQPPDNALFQDLFAPVREPAESVANYATSTPQFNINLAKANNAAPQNSGTFPTSGRGKVMPKIPEPTGHIRDFRINPGAGFQHQYSSHKEPTPIIALKKEFNPAPGSTISMEQLQDNFHVDPTQEHQCDRFGHYKTKPVFENIETLLNPFIQKNSAQLINIDNKKSAVTAEHAFQYCKLNGYCGEVRTFVNFEWGHGTPAERVQEYIQDCTKKNPNYLLKLPLLFVKNGVGHIAKITSWVEKNPKTGISSDHHQITTYKKDGSIDNKASTNLTSLNDCDEMWLYETRKRFPIKQEMQKPSMLDRIKKFLD